MLDVNKKHQTQYCIPISLRDEQIRLNVKKIPDRIEPGELSEEPIAIVGFGASLKDTWEEIKNFKTIFSVSGSHKFLLEKGITPTYHVEVDPREHKIELLGTPNKGTIYLPASCCHPKYIKHIHNSGALIKLWHVFALDGESEQVIPKGEWSITGGCDVGMRAMTIARFLGYKNFHIFGMDGCVREEGSHASYHPNAIQKPSSTVYEGVTYKTTPSLLESAKQVFHELNQLPDVTAVFYGKGLTQAMAKNYIKKTVEGTLQLAEKKPPLISEELRKLNSQLHEDNPHYGMGGSKYADTVLKMKTEEISSILDYGAGKQQLAKSLPFPIWSYDPAIPEISESPRPADLVICTDVLEHVEHSSLSYVLEDLKRVTLKVGYFVIHLGPAKKTYADGRNAHLIQESAEWWVKRIKEKFDVAQAVKKGVELHLVVGPWKSKVTQETIVGVRGKDGIKSRYYTPNDICRWRVDSLSKKEPHTLEWIEKMEKDSIFFDIGANVGMYSVWASVRGIQTYAFEPEAENYALLVKNLALNGYEGKAFCVGVSDSSSLTTLHLSGRGAGGSCHSLSIALDPFGKERQENHHTQGSIALSLDSMIEMGLPTPDYIKIDVDGLEPSIIKGALKTLKKVKSLLIEINPSLETHQELLKILFKAGFTYDQSQVAKATRQSGPFQGVAEYLFWYRSPLETHLLQKIQEAELKQDPFPYFIVDEALPQKEYEMVVNNLTSDSRVPIKKVRGLRGYKERFVDTKGTFIEADIRRGSIKKALLEKFGVPEGDYYDETLLIHDEPGYKIGPHTDNPARVLSALLYLPPIGSEKNCGLGTTLYKPKDPSFKCDGGPHYSFEKFEEVKTIGYAPNRMFVFLKTDTSFHGVKQTLSSRDVLLYDIRRNPED